MATIARRIAYLENKVSELNTHVDLEGLSDEELEALFQEERAKLSPKPTGDDLAQLFSRWEKNPSPSLREALEGARSRAEARLQGVMEWA